MDSYWPDRSLVVEVDERQHDHPVTHFDKRYRLTVSGEHRGEQRRIYDERRRSLVPAHGLTLLTVRTSQLAVDAQSRLLCGTSRPTTSPCVRSSMTLWQPPDTSTR